jgi:ubiquinone/menaquinone biosynthesis C-methylase UbiE
VFISREELRLKKTDIALADVQGVYSGHEGKLWELIMGEQIHAGGMRSSYELATRAGIKEGMRGIDLCCCLGAGMRFLVKTFHVEMYGIDATEAVISKASQRAEDEGMERKLNFKVGNAMNIPYENEKFDFVWGEDAWCYVIDKDILIQEAVRVLKPGGIIAFTDWIEGATGLSDEEALRINTFMKFPDMKSIKGYHSLLVRHGFEIKESTEIEFAKYVDLYITMLTEQLSYDALKILGDDMDLFQAMGVEMDYMRNRIHEGKMARGRFIGVKKSDQLDNVKLEKLP